MINFTWNLLRHLCGPYCVPVWMCITVIWWTTPGEPCLIFDFLEVDTTEHYLDVCAEKVFKSESRSRNTIVWTPEKKEIVERRMKKYEMLNRYSFTSE